ncbi:UDP-2,4-diacetamido-2,4,6-trideoxy-beta-L-altropyranose hydrolase [Polynucleobacter paneuropaeus]|nr:UDP-2,4-diacetamido-2,4,6-trideoxy-beta-L-altropyranose hydrolase [Polynucleobacter paneuropaeus]
MNIVFRVDASIDIGSGHVMRCLTLARALREDGATCIFICRNHTGNMIDDIRKESFDVYVLPLDQSGSQEVFSYEKWLGAPLLVDLSQSIQVLKDLMPDWVVVDHYGIDATWEIGISQFCLRIMAIDDFSNRAHACNILLNQNITANKDAYQHLVENSCTMLLGPSYAILRPEFVHLRSFSLSRRRESRLKRIFISMGGVDSLNVTSSILSALKTCNLPGDICIDVVMGKNAPWRNEVNKIALSMPWLTRVIVDAKNMAELMSESDLAIGAAGSTTWELCCLGSPSILVITAENQRETALVLAETGIALTLDNNSLSDDGIRVEIKKITENLDLLKQMTEKSSRIVDGLGISRIKPFLLECNSQ